MLSVAKQFLLFMREFLYLLLPLHCLPAIDEAFLIDQFIKTMNLSISRAFPQSVLLDPLCETCSIAGVEASIIAGNYVDKVTSTLHLNTNPSLSS